MENSKSTEAALSELVQKGIPFSESEFLHQIALGREQIIDIFLAAGMSPNATNSHEEPAVVVAAKNGHSTVVAQLCNAGAKMEDLVRFCESAKTASDPYKRVNAFAPYATALATLAVAVVGGWFTHSYNVQQSRTNSLDDERNAELHRIEIIEKVVPDLRGDDKSQKVALLLISSLNPELASKIGGLMRGPGVTEAFSQMTSSAALSVEQQTDAKNAGLPVWKDAKQNAVALATQLLNEKPQIRRVWGGKTPAEGFDASGFPSYVLNQAGILANYKSFNSVGLQAKYHMQSSADHLQEGDLVFYEAGNCMLYVGDDDTGKPSMIGMLSTGIRRLPLANTIEDGGQELKRLGFGTVSLGN